jgi:hypothetical protein
MRKTIAGLALVALVMGRPVASFAGTAGGEVGLAVGATAINLVYFPIRAAVAAGWLVLGAVAGTATGGDERAAYSFWVPGASGTFFVTPGHLDGSEPFEFWGTEYSDRPSTAQRGVEGTTIYRGLYDSM